jgi:hypothetical protein
VSPAERLLELGIAVPLILVPGKGTAPETWSVIACDQHTSDRAYWEETRRIVGGRPSTLELIIPECYLEDGNRSERAAAANAAMTDYLERGILERLDPGFVLVDRSTPHATRRRGLVLAIDLEAYDFSEGSQSAVRPTEGTIRDRLPPRMAVRRGATLDLPHVLLLIDDPDDTVMSAAAAAAGEKVYDFELIQGGGHISGRRVPAEAMAPLAEAFERLVSDSGLLFAVGDGNHSLATAKEIWKEKKKAGVSPDHPARFALVEVENIHDEGLHFHPIHRVLFGVDVVQIEEFLRKELGVAEVNASGSGEVKILTPGSGEALLTFDAPKGHLAVEPLQEVLDDYLAGHPMASIDYIHGEDAVRDLVDAAEDRVGLILPDLDKAAFFKRIAEIGPYPRKTFSIGEAVEKRYYLEARKLSG